jgi:hypothetical protein
MSMLATKGYAAFFIYFITPADYGYSILIKKEKSSNRYKRFFPGRGLIKMAEPSVLLQEMRSRKFQNFNL